MNSTKFTTQQGTNEETPMELGIPISAAAADAARRKPAARLVDIERKTERRAEIPSYITSAESAPAVAASESAPESARAEIAASESAEEGGITSMTTKTKRPRRRTRLSYTARVIMGFSLAFILCTPVLSISLWNPAAQNYYTQAKKVFRNGDIITIVVSENTSADHTWNAEREKQWQVEGTASADGIGAGTKNLFGRFFPFMGLEYQSQLKTDNQSDRKTQLSATVAAEVVNVMPNGNLQIIARKVIRVNSEEQLIELTGNIRPDDVSENNMISSTAIADASIKVNGSLRYMNDQKPSALERVFSFISGLFL